jgi:hypothetical protein
MKGVLKESCLLSLGVSWSLSLTSGVLKMSSHHKTQKMEKKMINIPDSRGADIDPHLSQGGMSKKFVTSFVCHPV